MNNLPLDWSQQLQQQYPARSGPCGWMGMKLMLAVRRALQTHTWEQIIDGVKAYKNYCDQSGRTASEFVLKPQTFFEEGIYAEQLSYQAPVDPKEAERQRQAASRMLALDERGAELGLKRYTGESAAAFETRIKLESTRNHGLPVGTRLSDQRGGLHTGHRRQDLGVSVHALTDKLKRA